MVKDPTSDQVTEKLRRVLWPGYDQDIVAAGFIKAIDVRDCSVHIVVEARTRKADKIAFMDEGIRREVSSLAGVERVEVRHVAPEINPVLSEGGLNTPLQAEVAADGVVPDPDPMLGVVESSDDGPRWDGKRPGRGRPVSTEYEGSVPVHQWDIDPTNPTAKAGEAHVTLGDWEYRMWWQIHPEDLVYVSIQAILDDTISHGETARAHPVGRAIAVNLVYDLKRAAVVAIYGTASDFRPFVEAFCRGYGLPDSTSAMNSEKE